MHLQEALDGGQEVSMLDLPQPWAGPLTLVVRDDFQGGDVLGKLPHGCVTSGECAVRSQFGRPALHRVCRF